MDATFSMVPSEEIANLKAYVTCMDECRYDHQAEGSLRLDVTHSNLMQQYHDLLFHEEMTIQRVKEKLFRHCGTGVGSMELFLRRGGSGGTIFLDDDSRQLRYYGAGNGMEIHIKDNDPHSLSRAGGLEDVSQIEKYVMSEADYDKRSKTVRSWKRAEAEKKKAEAEARGEAAEEGQALDPPPEDLEELVARFPVGSRCEVDPGARRG
jgi:tubulin-folding cofactor B